MSRSTSASLTRVLRGGRLGRRLSAGCCPLQYGLEVLALRHRNLNRLAFRRLSLLRRLRIPRLLRHESTAYRPARTAQLLRQARKGSEASQRLRSRDLGLSEAASLPSCPRGRSGSG